MKLPRILGLHAAVLSTLMMAAPAHADWVVSPLPEAVRPVPYNYQVMPQNPPAFAWSRHTSNPPAYVLEVWRDGVLVYTFNTARNWYLPSRAFPMGNYSWRVRPSTTAEWSTHRNFSITTGSRIFQVPENVALRSAVTSKVRPRELPVGFKPVSGWDATMQAERGKPLTALRADVDWKIPNLKPVSDADWPLTSATATASQLAAQGSDIRNRINSVARQLESSALLYRLTLDPKYLLEAKKRGDQLAALSPTGPTSYANQDQATRAIALSLMKAVDLLYRELESTRRYNWQRIVDVRGTELYNVLSGNNLAIDQYPFDSHGGTNLGFLALISTLALGDIPNASKWFDFATRAYINTVYAWSGPEGGFANGTAYGQYTADFALQIWQPLSQATGVNLFSKPWSSGFMQFFTHFLPPGATRHAFGDENELRPDFRFLKAYASRFNSPQAAWYANNITGDEDALTLLQAPYPLPVKLAASVVPPPNAALYPSIGWVAMHSNITDRNRTSLFFKSSPYGAYNHSHGDQNAFTLSSAGRPLLVEAGYMDYYNSPLFHSWYRTTKAHNAVTFDGGIGQVITGNTATLNRNGKITAFSTSASLDYAEGDATAAYGSAVSSAIRKVWYLRTQDAVVVQDKLVAPAAHAWEWNLHAAAPINAVGDGSVAITNVDRSVCVRPLVRPASGSLSYQVRTGPAPKAGTYEAHGAFVHPSSTRGEFVMLLDVGCKRPSVTMTETATSRTFKIGTQSITMPK